MPTLDCDAPTQDAEINLLLPIDLPKVRYVPTSRRAVALEQIAPSTQGIRPQLDGLRALAMVGVLYVHFWDNAPVAEHVRVTLFLVISGFLITHILVTAKARGGVLVVRNFYLRRALRLFPALVVTFCLAWLLDADGFRASAIWHLMPTSNLYFANNETTRPWVVGHLWSLNLLEQFYLIWPLVVLYLSNKSLHVIVVLWIAGLTFVRVNAPALGVDGWWLFFVFSFDPILMGSLAYLLQRHKPAEEVLTGRAMVFLASAVLASPLIIAELLSHDILGAQLSAWSDFGRSESYRFFAQPALAILVIGAFKGYRGAVGRVLESPPSRYLAKISYGVYVYHLLAWHIIVQNYPALFAKGPITFLVMGVITMTFATLSWYLVEKPIGELKQHFPVRRAAAPCPDAD